MSYHKHLNVSLPTFVHQFPTIVFGTLDQRHTHIHQQVVPAFSRRRRKVVGEVAIDEHILNNILEKLFLSLKNLFKSISR